MPSFRTFRSLCWGLAILVAGVASAQAPVYTENFESYGAPGEPPGWFDSAPGNPDNEAPGQFKVWNDPIVGGNRAFGHKGASESYSHYRARTFAAADGFRFEGRMMRTKSKAHLGVTFLSDFPLRDEHYRLALTNDNGTVRLEGRGSGSANGDTESGVSLDLNVWYRFAIEVEKVGAIQRIRAKIWKGSQSEPSAWQIDATDDSGERQSGWIGVWAEGSGEKQWDDLNVRSTAVADTDPPAIQITEGGAALSDGALFSRAVVPAIQIVDASTFTSTAMLDGQTFVSGTTVGAEGAHTLAVSATDASGNTASKTVHFTIDRTAPQWVSILPPGGSLTRDLSVVLSGQVTGATAVTIDGVPASLSGSAFTSVPLTLNEGERVFTLIATDAAGNATSVLHTIARDSLPPQISIATPSASVVAASPIEVAGSAIDPHLATVVVNGRPAALSGVSFALAGLVLSEGANSILVRATDAVGNVSETTRGVVLDTIDPLVSISEAGQPFVDGARFHRDVVPVISATDATDLSVTVRLDGAVFASGSTISEEGEHELSVEAIDAAGHRTARLIHFEIDRTPPVLSDLDPADGSLVSSAQVVVRGRAAGAASVSVGGQAATLDGALFVSQPVNLADGENSIPIVAEDAAGNRALATLRLTRDDVAPTLSVSEPAEGAFPSSPSISVVGSASDLHLESVRVAGAAAVLAGDAFRRDGVDLSPGANTILVEARDGAGNVARLERHVVLDDQPPVVRILVSGVELADGARFGHAISVTIEVQDATATTIETRLDGSPYVSGMAIATDGVHTLSATATDAAGNRTSRAIEFEIDVAAPVFAETAPADGAVLSAAEVLVTGRVRGATSVQVEGSAATLAGEDFTAGPFPLAEGARTFHLVARDEVGNRAEKTISIVRDATAPTVAITQPAAEAVVGTTTISVSGTAVDPRLDSVKVNGVVATVASGGSFVAAQVPLVEGSNELVARALDSAGNAAEARRSVVLDTLAPEIAILDPAAGTIVATDSIEVSGTVSDAHLDRVTVSGVAATVGDGTFRATVPLSEGVQTLVARAVDVLGHSDEATISVERRSTAPQIEIQSPVEGLRTSAATVAVSGTVEAREGLVVTVAGISATLSAGHFSAPDVPLVEGENRLIARARDPLGNEGVHTRVVIRDTEAPRFLASDPAAGAQALPVDTIFRLTFSEELAAPAPGAVRLSASGVEIPFDLEAAGAELTLRSRAPLPASAALRLELTAGLVDLAGNSLANPIVVELRVADQTAPGAPVLLPPPPAALCAESLALVGTAEPNAALLVEGGAGVVSGRAEESGAFSLAVSLVPNALNRLRLFALDGAGNRSPAVEADVLADCIAPAVLSAERLAAGFAIAFSEEIDPSSAAGAVTLTGAEGEIDGALSIAADRRSLLYTPDAPLAEGAAVRLEVGTAIRDLAGNALQYPYVRRFGGAAGESFFAGTALDAATGRPLAGVRVDVEATDGLPLEGPVEQTTTADGRFQLAVLTGAHRVRFAREGWTPVVRTVATEPNEGVDVFDPRLSPRAAPVSVGAAGGRANGSGGAWLDLPAGALAASASVSVTALDEQALPAALPLGWSPRGAAWIELGAALSAAASLHLPVEAPDGTELVLAALDSASLSWRVVGFAQVASGAVSVPVARGGGYAALDPDLPPAAPPVAVVGAPLGAASPGGEVTSASVIFDPEQVLPGQRSQATVTYGLGADPAALPSGTPLTLEVREELRLLGGEIRREAPFFADLAIYRTTEGAPRSKFYLQPSEAAELLPIDLGHDEVTVNVYGTGGGAGNVVGPGGGSVSSAEGDRLDIPAGALDASTAVIVERRSIADLPLALPAGLAAGDVAGVVRVDLGGRTLRLPAALSLSLGGAPAADQDGLLLAVVDRGQGPVLEAVARLLPTAEGFTTAPIDSADLPFSGVRRGGFYLFVRTPSLGFFRGTAFGTNGVARGGIEIAVRDAFVRPWRQASAEPSGRYVLPSVVGAATVLARDPAVASGGDSIEVASAIPTADARVDLDLQLQVVGPRLLATTPVDGASGVPPGIEPTATFSEAVSATSLAEAIRLVEIAADGGERTLDVTIESQGALVRVIPTATLAPETLHELSVGTGVLDLEGNALENAAAIRFTTAAAAPENGALDLSKVSLLEPDASGFAQVLGAPGAVPSGTLLVAENSTALVSVPSVEAGADGSFSLSIAASVRDTLLLHVLRPGANELVVELGPFLTSDRRGALVGPRGARFTTVDGYEVGVAAGTFADLARVRLAPLPTAGAPPALPDWLSNGADFTLDFGGATATKPLEIALPRPAGAVGDGPFLLLRQIDLDGGRVWMLHDLMRLDGTRLTTAEAPAGTSAPLAVSALAGSNGAADALVGNVAQRPKEYLPGAAFPGTYRIAAPTVPMAFIAASYPPGGGVSFAFAEDDWLGAAIDQAVARLLSFAAILLPTRVGHPVHMIIRDLSSGIVRFDGDLEPPAAAGEVTLLPIDAQGDRRAPWPIGGSPFRFFTFTASGGDTELAPGLVVRLLGSQLSVKGEEGALPAAIQARLVGLDDSVNVAADSSATGALTLEVPAERGRRYVLGLGGKIGTGEAIQLSWSESLESSLAGITILDDKGANVVPEKTLLGGGDIVRLAPESGWRAGKTYTLRLGPIVSDAAGNQWAKTFDLRFSIRASEVLDTYALDSVREIARLGNWLFVAADKAGLVVLDASDPRNLKNAIPGDVTFPWLFNDPVRAVAIDAHNRVLIAGGGVQDHGRLKVFDPLRFDPAAIAASPDDPDIRFAAFRGSVLLSDAPGMDPGTQLLEGAPRKIAVLSNDITERWDAGTTAPSPLSAILEVVPGGAMGTLTVSGAGAAPGAPVTLRSGGRWMRVLADEDGAFSVGLTVRRGEEVELKRNQQTLAYVATLGVGVEVVDVNAFFEKPEPTGPRASDLLGVYTGIQDPSLSLCGEGVSELGSALIDLDGLFDGANHHPLTVVGAVGNRGLAIIESNPSAVGEMSFLSQQCAEIDGSRAVAALEVLADYGFDLNDNGAITPDERRDYVLLAHRVAGVLVYDVTDRAMPRLKGRIRVGFASAITADRAGRRLFVSVGGEGIAIVDFDHLPNLDPLDRNGDGKDDRVLEMIALGAESNNNAPVFVAPELGLVFAGGLDQGVTSVAIGHPLLYAIDAQIGGSRGTIDRVVPFGVPNASPAGSGTFRLVAYLPGVTSPSVAFDVRSLGPTGARIAPIGSIADTPSAPAVAREGAQAIQFRRDSDDPREDGITRYVSDPIVALADMRASRSWQRTARENEICVHCLSPSLTPANAVEILSGDTISVRPNAVLAEHLSTIYGAERAAGVRLDLPSTRWEMSPSLRQEPRLGANLGAGEAAPGTLLASGETTFSSADLVVRGRGLDFVFSRTYRSQTVGGGPLGPGWDFGFNMRLRELPNGDVELFDGRLRRERYEKNGDFTYTSPQGFFSMLTKSSSGFLLIESDHSFIRFDLRGRLVSIADGLKDSETSGNEIRFEYNAASQLATVVDSLDRRYTLTYDDDGRLTRLADFDGRVVKYRFDDLGRLEEVELPGVTSGVMPEVGARITHYSYAAVGSAGGLAARWTVADNLTQIRDPRDRVPLELTYADADGDQRPDEVASQRWGTGTVTLSYDFAASQTTVTDRRSHTTTYLHDAEGRAIRREDPMHAVWTWEYDEEGLPIQATLPLGRKIEWSYGSRDNRRARGNATLITETADGRGTNGSPAKRVTKIDYHGWSNAPTRIVDPRQTVTTIRRSATGLPLEIRRAAGTLEEIRSTIAYNAYGQPTEIKDPKGSRTALEYFDSGASRGYLERERLDTAGLNLATSYEVDPRGNVLAMIDPRGVRTEYAWNEADWPVSVTAAATGSNDGAPRLGYVTRHFHDAIGQRVKTEEPDGKTGDTFLSVQRTFGLLGELLKVRRQIGADTESVVSFDYDENLNRLMATAPNQQKTRWTYDDRNLPEVVERGFGTPEAIRETLDYNLEGQIVAQTDGRSKVWPIEYDGYGRTKVARDPLGNATEMTYDANDNLLTRSALSADATRLAETKFEYDLLDRRKKAQQMLWQPDAERTEARELETTYTYDAVDQLVTVTDPLGRATTFEYDGAHRQKLIRDALGNEQEVELDGRGNPKRTIRREQVAGALPVTVIESARYDALGRQIERTDALSNTWQTTWDARNRVLTTKDPEGAETTRTYDGLDRLTKQQRPAGIVESWSYDESSRLLTYTDARNQSTRYDYDPLDRPKEILWPDNTKKTITYDLADNAQEIRDPNGNVIVQEYDDANRLTTRTVTKALGVLGPVSETYAWDGLSRLTSATSGDQTVGFEYDSLSRTLKETQNGVAVKSIFDDAGNRAQLEYPSGLKIGTRFDDVDRVKEVFEQVTAETEIPVASYKYRGEDLLASESLGLATSGTWSYDDARRPTKRRFTSGLGGPRLDERLTWSPRGQLTSISRKDLGGRGFVYGYDQASQLETRAIDVDPGSLVLNNAVVLPEILSILPIGESFDHDNAQNLTSRNERGIGRVDEVPLLVDPKRNRPSFYNGSSLTWDSNGNLTSKGDLDFKYDYRNRLTRVTRFGTEIASYSYDALNRRTKRTVGDSDETTVWNGWQAIEERADDTVEERKVYGLGLDEVVERAKANGAGSFDRYSLLYSTTGEPVAQLASNGRPVERYAQSALGERKVYVDAERPAATQVSAKPNGIRIELSEQVQEPAEAAGPSAVLRAQAQGFTLTEVATGAPIEIEAKLAPEPGPGLERRRLEIHVPSPPPAGTQVRLSLSPEALEDFFANRPDDMSEWTFAWPAAGISIIEDTAPPELVRALLKDGKVEATFSKEVTAAGLRDTVAVDGVSVEWTISPDGRVATTSTVLPGGLHHIEFGTGPIDLADKGLASPIAVDLTVPTGERRDLAGLVVLLFELLNQRELAQSPTGQQASFQGHPVDPETGFVYLRNRYFDPELGRFITADPMGYPDGPSEYAFGAGDVVNGRDPLGLAVWNLNTKTGETTSMEGDELYRQLLAEGLGPREASRWVMVAGEGGAIGADVTTQMAPYMRASGKLINRMMLSSAAAGIAAPLLAEAAAVWGLGTLSSSVLVGSGSAIAGQGGADLADQRLSSLGTYARVGAAGGALGLGFGLLGKGIALSREARGMGEVFEGAEYAFVDGTIAEAREFGAGFNPGLRGISDDAFVRFDPTPFDSSIADLGIRTRFFEDGKIWLARYGDVKHIANARDLERFLYRQSLWVDVSGKFDQGATLRLVHHVDDAVAAGVTNRVNGVRQWRILRDVEPSDLEMLLRLDPYAP